MEEQKKQSVGAMWSKTSKNEKQTKYYTISLDTKQIMDDNGNMPEKVNLIAFRNFYKQEDKQPDYKIYKSEKREYIRTTEKEDDEIDKIGDTMTQEEIDSLGDDEIPF